jgi:hypothetical protein
MLLPRHESRPVPELTPVHKAYRLALSQEPVTQMLTTKHPMLSSTHAIFQGLQDSLTESLRSLLYNTPALLCEALLNAHWKLSDYYRKFDESPYYTWASRMSHIIIYIILN